MAARVTVDSVARGTSRTYNARRLAAGAASGGGSSELARLLVQIWKFVQNEPAPSCDGGVWSCNGGGWSCDGGGWSCDGGGWSCDGGLCCDADKETIMVKFKMNGRGKDMGRENM
ncbi:hypothetical protein VNO80_10156 [Phaseolus coccineus]|uniref:Uncharacterized protein n=1 Tax=Phaseolus coccineus TaxID=3886 RepID=A0AAN9REE8_PHACN